MTTKLTHDFGLSDKSSLEFGKSSSVTFDTLFNSRKMNVNLGIWDKLTKLVLVLLVIAGIVAVSVWYLPLIRKNERMRNIVLRLEAEVRKEEEQAKQLRTTLEATRSDPRTIERLVREQLGFARPGEIVVRFEEISTNAPVRR